MSRSLSLPHEHGGYLTIGGATVAGVALACTRGPAIALGAVVAAAFFVRAPIEELARGRGARLDWIAVTALTTIVLAGAIVLGGAWAAASLGVAAAMICGSLLARGVRWQRSMLFEAIGMSALGASAGLVALAGGVDLHIAAALAVAVGTHTGLAVPLVRSEVRPRERARARDAERTAFVVVTAAALTLFAIGAGGFSIALAPRGMHALSRRLLQPPAMRPSVIGLRESTMLVLVVIVLVVVPR